MNKQEYSEYIDSHAPRSSSVRNMLRAFLCGGAICTLGQFIMRTLEHYGADSESAAAGCSVLLILFGVILTALGVYDRLAKFAGAGSLVPITGFANAVAAPAIEFRTEGIILGTAAKMFVIAGPVIVSGISSGTVYGLILCLWKLIFGL